MPQEFFLADEIATKTFGNFFASVIKKGDILTLTGDLGMGKTSLARAIIQKLMNDKNLNVPSPSFSLVQPYQNNDLNIFHVDLYRIKNEIEIEELGLFDDDNAVIIAEWAQNAPDFAAKANWKIYLTRGDNNIGRNIKIIGDEAKLKRGSLDEFRR